MNQYQEESAYALYSNYLGYIRIGGGETATLPKNYRSCDFLELKEYEFFSVSEAVTQELNTVRQEILHGYGIGG